MALKPPDMIDADDLTEADEEILNALYDGPLTKGAIVDKTGLHRNTVGNRLDALKFGDAIRLIHEGTALYELADDPRGDVELDLAGPHPSWDVSELENNLPNVKHDGDPIEVTCPVCETAFALGLALAVEYGAVECESCGSEFGLLLVERGDDDE